jgi:cytochrome oxidase Cu insertion factor (SCO1/SenC/PrrC family)
MGFVREGEPRQPKCVGSDSVFKNFELTSYDGKKVNLADLRGKVVLISFWFPT